MNENANKRSFKMLYKLSVRAIKKMVRLAFNPWNSAVVFFCLVAVFEEKKFIQRKLKL